MSKTIARLLSFGLIAAMGLGLITPLTTYAEGEDGSTSEESSDKTSVPGTNISLTPVSKILQISSNSVYEDDFSVSNEGDTEMKIEVYAAPYSYVYSSDSDSYQLGFNNENNFTQISRWITFKNADGSYEKKTEYTIQPRNSLNVHYKISTPDNIPAGGQYAVIFAHTLTGTVSANGIKTEASPGIVVYGRSTEGEAIVKADINDLKLEQGYTDNEGNKSSNFRASAKVKNTGNVDFNAVGVLTVDPIIGGASYETPANAGRVSIIPEAELVVSDEWKDTPGFGLYKVTWTVSVGENVQAIEKLVLINPLLFIFIVLIVLTIIIVCVIIGVKKRKERRSRLAI